MFRTVPAAIALCFVLAAGSAAAADVQLQMANGRVTLHASNATLRQILDEWARVGQTTIVNANKLPPGGLITLDIEDMPEAQALDIVLRSVSGYLAAPRRVAVPTLSHFDRVVIVPSVAPAPESRPVSSPAPAVATPQRPPGFPPGFNPAGRPPFSGAAGTFAPTRAPDDDAPITNIVMPTRGAVFNGFQQPQLVPAPDGSSGAPPSQETPAGRVIVPPTVTRPSIPGATVDPSGGTSIPGVIVQPQQPQTRGTTAPDR